jgi:pSer/pThr/pTyr-binding forkhead associated (FHA) protein
VLGRHDKKSQYIPDVDLLPYHAQKLGVSRQHARMIFKDNRFYIIDLNSTNGTSVNYQRLKPNDMFAIKPGDIIQLGHFTMRVE